MIDRTNRHFPISHHLAINFRRERNLETEIQYRISHRYFRDRFIFASKLNKGRARNFDEEER